MGPSYLYNKKLQISNVKCQMKPKAQRPKNKRKNGMMENWNVGLNKNIPEFSYITPELFL
jgi:hypothetical protein